jgi:hypothetical protein
VLVAQAVRRSFQPTRHVLTIVPDDAFYYIDLARHFAQSGTWTFDGGLSRTTGFHPFHAYVCALVCWLWPEAPVHPLLTLHAWIGTVVTLTGLWFLIRVVDRHFGTVATMGVIIVSTGSNFLTQATNVMEWHWVVLFASLTVFAITEGRAGLAFAAALGGALSRSDFPLIVVAAVAAGGLVAYRKGDRALLRCSLIAFGGAVAGFILLTAQNYVIAHELVQSSARVKAFWGKVAGYHLRYGFEIAANAAAPGSYLVEVGQHSIKLVIAAHAAVAIALVALLRVFPPAADPETPRSDDDRRTFLVVLALVSVVGYAAFYATTSVAIMTWYTANFVVPVALLYSAALRPLRWRYTFPVLFAPAALFALVGLRNADLAALPNFGYEMDAGLWLKEHPRNGRVAGWNVGILNYFQGGDIVNIDGLTNNDVVPYILADKLHCYLLDKRILYVMDWEPMVDCKGPHCPDYPALGGYTSGTFLRSLRPEYVVPGTEDLKNAKLTLYAVDRSVIGGAGDCGSVRGAE